MIDQEKSKEQLITEVQTMRRHLRDRTSQLEAQIAGLRAILRSIPDGIIITQQRGDIIQANPSAESLITETLSPQDVLQLREAARDLTQRIEMSGYADGFLPQELLELSDLILEVKASPVVPPASYDADHQPAAVVTVHDITHLEASDRFRTRFASILSHELQTPITTIKLYLSLIQVGPPEKWQEYLAVITHETARLARLVHDMTQIVRIDTGRLRLRREPVSVRKVVESAFANLQPLAQDREVTVLCDIPQGVGSVEISVDPGRIEEALTNLAQNCLQHTHPGDEVVFSAGTDTVDGRTWAVVKAADTGISLPEDDLPHTFEPFFQGTGQQVVQALGTGLGLAIAEQIVALHGGQVNVESKPDVGTTYTVRLPQHES